MSLLIEVIVNAASGTGDKEKPVRIATDIFDDSGIRSNVSMARSGAEISEMAKQAADGECQTIVAGGGDGTISTVAAGLVGKDKTLGVLPLGTLNHFAKDLKVPLDVEEAARVIIAGHTVTVDVGEVNGRIFVNNSSLGLYPEVVRGRERGQRLGYGKWNSLVRSALKVLRRHPFLDVRLNAEGEEIAMRTPFVFIGNNEYEMEGFNIGSRARLDAGKLSLYMAPDRGRLGLLTLALRAFFGNLRQAKDFVHLSLDEVWIETRHRQMRIAMDGEVSLMRSPFHYRARPRALRVIVPSK